MVNQQGITQNYSDILIWTWQWIIHMHDLYVWKKRKLLWEFHYFVTHWLPLDSRGGKAGRDDSGWFLMNCCYLHLQMALRSFIILSHVSMATVPTDCADCRIFYDNGDVVFLRQCVKLLDVMWRSLGPTAAKAKAAQPVIERKLYCQCTMQYEL